MTFREFTGKNVEEAIRAAMAEYSADLGDLDIEILSQGSRGLLGVGGEEARILAAPKSAVEAAESVRAETPAPRPERARRESEQPGGIATVELAQLISAAVPPQPLNEGRVARRHASSYTRSGDPWFASLISWRARRPRRQPRRVV